jgi:hypothetical protein
MEIIIIGLRDKQNYDPDDQISKDRSQRIPNIRNTTRPEHDLEIDVNLNSLHRTSK